MYITKKLEEKISESKRYAHNMSIIMLDIDHFKKINDTYGHLVGDEVLKRISYVLKGEIRSSDIPGRFGDEEFLIILPNTNKKSASNSGKRIRRKIEELEWDHDRLKVTISSGVAELGSKNITELIKDADNLLL